MATPDYSSYVKAGLTGAQNAINNNAYQAYPAYTGWSKANPYAYQQNAAGMASSGYNPAQGVTNAPAANQMTGYNGTQWKNQGVTGLTGYNGTNYQGIGQSADSIRSNFLQPVNQAWDKSQSAIKSAYGANGLYGSLGGGLMSEALQDGAQNYMVGTAQANQLANQIIMENEMNRVNTANSNELNRANIGNSNAQFLANYGMQNEQNRVSTANSNELNRVNTANQNAQYLSDYNMAGEIARSNSYRDAYELAGNQNLDAWKAGLQTTDYNNQLLGNRIGFGNSQIDAAYADQLARRQDYDAYRQTQIENYLGLAGGGSPNAAAQMQANAQKSAASAAADASNTAAWLGAGGSLAGGLLSSYGDDIWNQVSSWF